MIPRLVPILSDLSRQLDDFDSVSKEKNDFADGQLVSIHWYYFLLASFVTPELVKSVPDTFNDHAASRADHMYTIVLLFNYCGI